MNLKETVASEYLKNRFSRDFLVVFSFITVRGCGFRCPILSSCDSKLQQHLITVAVRSQNHLRLRSQNNYQLQQWALLLILLSLSGETIVCHQSCCLLPLRNKSPGSKYPLHYNTSLRLNLLILRVLRSHFCWFSFWKTKMFCLSSTRSTLLLWRD